jgi:hypothetical protein
MSVAWDNQRTQPINVYGPPRTEDLVRLRSSISA